MERKVPLQSWASMLRGELEDQKSLKEMDWSCTNRDDFKKGLRMNKAMYRGYDCPDVWD